jgi:hypothetical protein
MPDPNKHAALAARGFKIQPTCSTCVHWGPTNPPWGKCPVIRHVHEKHTADEDGDPTGTPDIGHCNFYKADARSLELAVGADYVARYSDADSIYEAQVRVALKGYLAVGAENAKLKAEIKRLRDDLRPFGVTSHL